MYNCKTAFVFLSALFLWACATSAPADRKGDVVVDNGQVSVLVAKESGADYDRIRTLFADAKMTNSSEIDWPSLQPKLVSMKESPMANRLSTMIDKSFMTDNSTVMVRCCGGCAIAIPLSCSECDFICEQNRDNSLDWLFDFD